MSKKTERQVLKGVQQTGSYVLTSGQIKNSVPVPNEAIISKMDQTFTETEKPGNVTEYGFVGGSKNGELVGSSVTAGSAGSATEPPSYKASAGVKELIKSGAKAEFIVHSHPNTLRYNSKENSYTAGSTDASGADIRTNNSATYAEIVLGEQASNVNNPSTGDMQLATSKPGQWVPRTDTKQKVITFYNQSKTLKTMNYDAFKKVVEKIKNSQGTPVPAKEGK